MINFIKSPDVIAFAVIQSALLFAKVAGVSISWWWVASPVLLIIGLVAALIAGILVWFVPQIVVARLARLVRKT